MAPVFMVNPKRNKAGQFVKSKKKTAAKHAPKKKAATRVIVINASHAKKGASTMTMKRDKHGKFVKAASRAKTSHKKPAHAKHRTNPKHRTAAHKTAAHHAKHTTTRKHKHHRRNPKGQLFDVLKGGMLPAMIFPAAALAGDVLYGVIPLPATMRTGFMKPVGKLGVAAILGAVSSFVLPANIAKLVVGGLVGGVVYDMGKSYLQTTFPTLPLAGAYNYPELEFETMGDFGDGAPSFLGANAPSFLGDGAAFGPMGERVQDSVSAYVDA